MSRNRLLFGLVLGISMLLTACQSKTSEPQVESLPIVMSVKEANYNTVEAAYGDLGKELKGNAGRGNISPEFVLTKDLSWETSNARFQEILEKGGRVGIFPQGRLPVGDKEWPFKPGILYAALQSDAPIIPVYTDGCYGFGKRAHVMIGTPIRLSELTRSVEPDREETQRLLSLLEEKTNELKVALKERTDGEN